MRLAVRLFVTGLLLLLPACGGTVAPVPPAGNDTAPQFGKIKHIVFIFQENRTFDGIFGGPHPFANADAAGSGKLSDGSAVPLKEVKLGTGTDLDNDYLNWLDACDLPPLPNRPAIGQPWPCAMDGFDKNKAIARTKGGSPTDPYNYAPYSQTQPYWDIAKKYALADHFFSSHDSESYTAHQYLFAGQTADTVNAPKLAGASYEMLWGWTCYKNGEQPTYLWDPTVTTLPGMPSATPTGPGPCWGYNTLADLLNAQKKPISWRMYLPFFGLNVNSLASTQRIYGNAKYWPCPSWTVISCLNNDYFRTDSDRFFEDYIIENVYHGELPGVTWFLPPLLGSDHVLPKALQDIGLSSYGPRWVSDVVNTIGEHGTRRSSSSRGTTGAAITTTCRRTSCATGPASVFGSRSSSYRRTRSPTASSSPPRSSARC